MPRHLSASQVGALLKERERQLAASAKQCGHLEAALAAAQAAVAQQQEQARQPSQQLLAQVRQLEAEAGVHAAELAGLRQELGKREQRMEALELDAIRLEAARHEAQAATWDHARREMAAEQQKHAQGEVVGTWDLAAWPADGWWG